MYYILRVGCRWRDLPTQFGPWNSVYTRFRRWCRSGLWARLLAVVADEAVGEIRCLDCSHVKVHQDGSNAADGCDRQAIGQTKGGLNTKSAAVVDELGRAVAVCLAPGQRNDQKAVPPRCSMACAAPGRWQTAASIRPPSATS
jgi:transposase